MKREGSVDESRVWEALPTALSGRDVPVGDSVRVSDSPSFSVRPDRSDQATGTVHPHAMPRNRLRSNPKFALPYICLLIVFRRLAWPSVCSGVAPCSGVPSRDLSAVVDHEVARVLEDGVLFLAMKSIRSYPEPRIHREFIEDSSRIHRSVATLR
jgi:hypothetical protein